MVILLLIEESEEEPLVWARRFVLKHVDLKVLIVQRDDVIVSSKCPKDRLKG